MSDYQHSCAAQNFAPLCAHAGRLLAATGLGSLSRIIVLMEVPVYVLLVASSGTENQIQQQIACCSKVPCVWQIHAGQYYSTDVDVTGLSLGEECHGLAVQSMDRDGYVLASTTRGAK